MQFDRTQEADTMNMRTYLPAIWDRDEKSPVALGSFRREIEKLFDAFSRGFHLPETLGQSNGFDFAPDMDIKENDKQVALSLELPGVEEKDIDVSASGQVISVSGEKKSESEAKTSDMHRSERSYGSFFRSLSLPFNINGDKVRAKLTNGVLTVTIPKPAEVIEKTMKIAVNS
jgi:HSP20 family protein